MEQVNKIYRDKVKPVVNNQIKPQLQKFEAYVNNTQNPDQFVKLLAKAEALTGIKRTRICYGTLAALFVLFLFENAFKIVSLLVGTIYPAYKSFKAIESKEKDDDTQWLIYWVVFAFFSVIEIFTGSIVFWMPFYYVAKLVILVWCMYPDRKRNLSHILYHKVLRPFLIRKQDVVDSGLRAGAAAFRSAADAVDPKNQ